MLTNSSIEKVRAAFGRYEYISKQINNVIPNICTILCICVCMKYVWTCFWIYLHAIFAFHVLYPACRTFSVLARRQLILKCCWLFLVTPIVHNTYCLLLLQHFAIRAKCVRKRLGVQRKTKQIGNGVPRIQWVLECGNYYYYYHHSWKFYSIFSYINYASKF